MRVKVAQYILILLLWGLAVPEGGFALTVPDQYRAGVTVVHSDTMAPLSFLGYNGEAKGIVADFWRKWSQETGVPVDFRLSNWKTGLELIRTGQCDIHGGLFETDERLAYMDFSEGYLSLKTALIVLKSSQIKSMKDLRDKQVGVLAKGSSEEYMRRHYPSVKIVPNKNVRLAVESLVNGDVDALYMDYPTVMYISGTIGAAKEFVPVEFVTDKLLRASVAKGNVELMKLVEAGMAAIDSQERQRIMDNWFIEPHAESYNWMIVFAVLIVGIFCGLYLLLFGIPFRSS